MRRLAMGCEDRLGAYEACACGEALISAAANKRSGTALPGTAARAWHAGNAPSKMVVCASAYVSWHMQLLQLVAEAAWPTCVQGCSL